MPAAIQVRSSQSTSSTTNGVERRKSGSGERAKASAANKLQKGWHPIQWFQRLLKRPLKLKRIGNQLHVVLESTLSIQPSSKSGGRGEALRLAHLVLQQRLAQQDDARNLFPHLTHVEQALSRTGSRALITTPIRVLQRAMDQLDNLEGASRSPELLAMRLRVEEAIKQRTPLKLRDDISNLEVSDASHSQFEEVDRHWTGSMPLDAASEPARAVSTAK